MLLLSFYLSINLLDECVCECEWVWMAQILFVFISINAFEEVILYREKEIVHHTWNSFEKENYCIENETRTNTNELDL